MVESYANSVEDKLIDGLSFKLESGASYIHDRRSVSFHPSGSNIYNSKTGTKFIRIALTGKDWLDPSTFRVAFDVQNLETARTDAGTALNPFLRPLSGPWCMFRRIRLLAGSQVIEDIDQYSRVHQMMDILTAKDSRRNEVVEGFGYLWDEHATEAQKLLYTGIAPGDYQTVMFKPLCGLLNQNKFIPLEYVPLILELELIDDPADAVAANLDPFTNANNSLLWELRNVQVKCDVISLDSSVQESYHQVLMTSKEIPIHYNTLTSQYQTITENPFINVSRAATRLKSIFVTLDKDATTALPATAGRKAWNSFYSPASVNNRSTTQFKHNSADEFELAVQIGSKTFPDGNPIRSHAEAYYQLRKALGVQSSTVHSFDISPQEYRDDRFVMALDLEKSLGASFTGLNTRSGDLMTVKFKYKNPSDARNANRMHIVLHTDNILQIMLTGAVVYD